MNGNEMTYKVQEAIASGSQLAMDKKHPVVDIEHILWALMNDSSGTWGHIMDKLNIDHSKAKEIVDMAIAQKATISTVNEENIRPCLKFILHLLILS